MSNSRWSGLVLVFTSSLAVAADEVTFNDWGVFTADDKTFLYAVTANETQEVFGEYCYFKTGKCLWLLGLHESCEKDAAFPVLANSDSGSVALELVCLGKTGNNMYSYGFSSWKALEESLKDGSRIGFAYGLKSLQFGVVRFSLNGRTDSTSAMEKVFFDSQDKDHKQNASHETI